MEYQFDIYVLFSLLVSFYICNKTDKKTLSFIMVLWILSSPVLGVYYRVENIGNSSVDLQPNRILLIIMLFYLVKKKYLEKYYRRKNIFSEKPKFEKTFYFYLIAVFISLFINFQEIEKKTLIVIPSHILLFITIYHVLKRYATTLCIDAIFRAIIIVASVSAIIAFYQLLIDDSFMRLGLESSRVAFGSINRSTSIFAGEYELGYISIFAIIVILSKNKRRKIDYFLISILICSIVSTFHRLSWIITFLCLAVYLKLYLYKINIKDISKIYIIINSCIIMIVITFFISQIIFENSEKKDKIVDSFLNDRIYTAHTTIENRASQFKLAEKGMIKYPFGIGDYNTNEYQDLYHEVISKNTSKYYVVHNGYLSSGLKFGIFGLFTLCWMILSMLIYFWKKINKLNLITARPFFSILIWSLANITNDLSNFSTYFVLLVAIISGSFMAPLYNKKIKVTL